MENPGLKLSDIFSNIKGHQASAEIIRRFSTNPVDIREFAFEGIDFGNKTRFIDLGCGFGFLTEALKNKIKPGSTITGIDCHEEYRNVYLEACERIGIKGQFLNTGVEILAAFEPSSIDVVLSSYSLYFFPEVLPLLSRIIDKKGIAVFITHASTHLRELTESVLNYIRRSGFSDVNLLPHDRLIHNFTAENGGSKLGQFFGKVEKKEYRNQLIFKEDSVSAFLDYFSYKRSFFMPEKLSGDNTLYEKIERSLVEQFCNKEGCRITKNDAVFICSEPIKNQL
jgi:ubiquinone/menaquinone biosynthesis C-methylase UbiE